MRIGSVPGTVVGSLRRSYKVFAFALVLVSALASTALAANNNVTFRGTSPAPSSWTVNYTEYGGGSTTNNTCSGTGTARSKTISGTGSASSGITSKQSIKLGTVTDTEPTLEFARWSKNTPSGSVVTPNACVSGDTTAGTNSDVSALYARFRPTPPTVTLDAASDTGASSTDAITKDNTPTFTGTARANSTVQIFADGSTSLGTTTANGSGSWSFTPSTSLSDATHSITAKATDAAGGDTSRDSTALSITIDTTAPSALTAAPDLDAASDTGSSNTDDITSASTPTFIGIGAGANSMITVYDGSTSLGTTTANGSGSWSFTVASGSALSDGNHSIKATATDTAGNESGYSPVLSITIDTQVPDAPQINSPTNNTSINDATPTFSGTAEGDSMVELFDGSTSLGTTTANGSGSWSFTPSTSLSDATHSITAKAKDAAGNTSPASTILSITIDTAAPQTTIDSGTSGLINSTAATFVFSSSETGSTFECKLDSGAFESCASPKTYNGLSQGTHAFEVRATDVAGNTDGTPDSRTFTVDTQAPDAPQITNPSNNSYDNDGTFTVSGTAEANSTVELFEGAQSRGQTTANGSGSWSVALNGVSEVDHTYTAKATDAAGNESGSSSSVKVIVDTTAPGTTIDSGPSGTINEDTTSFEFSSNEPGSTFKCKLTKQGDTPGTFTGCSSPKGYADLTDGEYAFEVRAVDAAGNTGSAASRTFTVDTNDAPSASAQSITTDEDTPKTITLAASDPDGDNLTFEITNDPAEGSLITLGSVNCTGTAPKTCQAGFTYTPSDNYNGADSFKFRVNDGTDNSAKATVSITVAPVNDSPTADNDTATTDEDTAKVIDVKHGDTSGPANESDQNLTVTNVTDPAKGTAEIITGGADAGKVRYTPDPNYTGADSFGYTVCDDGTPSKCATATVNVNVAATDDAPMARDDSYKGKQKKTLKIKTPGVLKNDEDTDSTNLSVQVIQGPTKGMLTLNNNGSFTYKPKGSFKGKDTFTYKVNDGARDSNTATVTITVR